MSTVTDERSGTSAKEPLQAMTKLGRAIALEAIPQITLVNNQRKIGRLKSKITQYEQMLERLDDNLLGIERGAVSMIEERLSRFRALRSKLEREERETRLQSEKARQKAAKQDEVSSKYHLVSLEPLLWRDEQNLPLLAVFALDDAEVRITVESDGDFSYRPQMPAPIRNCYKDLARRLRRSYHTTTIKCSFAGFIPTEVKEKIQRASGDFGGEIYIIAEVDRWSMTQEETHPKRDPLVVGVWDGKLWLIAAFDTTTIEEHAFYTLPAEA